MSEQSIRRQSEAFALEEQEFFGNFGNGGTIDGFLIWLGDDRLPLFEELQIRAMEKKKLLTPFNKILSIASRGEYDEAGDLFENLCLEVGLS